MLTAVDRYSDQRKKDHAKEKSKKDLFQYIPIQHFHSLQRKEIMMKYFVKKKWSLTECRMQKRKIYTTIFKISYSFIGASTSPFNAASASLLRLNPKVFGHSLIIARIRSAISLSLSFFIATISARISLRLSPLSAAPRLYTSPTIADCSTGCNLKRSG